MKWNVRKFEFISLRKKREYWMYLEATLCLIGMIWKDSSGPCTHINSFWYILMSILGYHCWPQGLKHFICIWLQWLLLVRNKTYKSERHAWKWMSWYNLPSPSLPTSSCLWPHLPPLCSNSKAYLHNLCSCIVPTLRLTMDQYWTHLDLVPMPRAAIYIPFLHLSYLPDPFSLTIMGNYSFLV